MWNKIPWQNRPPALPRCHAAYLAKLMQRSDRVLMVVWRTETYLYCTYWSLGLDQCHEVHGPCFPPGRIALSNITTTPSRAVDAINMSR